MTLLDRSLDLSRGVANGLKQGLRHGMEQIAAAGQRTNQTADQLPDTAPPVPPADSVAPAPTSQGAESAPHAGGLGGPGGAVSAVSAAPVTKPARPPREPRPRRVPEVVVVDVAPPVEPKFGIDGWTFEGTALAGRFPLELDAEAAGLMHNVGRGMATTWIYERLCDLLISHKAPEQALAVLDMYLRQCADRDVTPDRGLARRRQHVANKVAKAAKAHARRAAAGKISRPAGGRRNEPAGVVWRTVTPSAESSPDSSNGTTSSS
jgi:hypothetical protein